MNKIIFFLLIYFTQFLNLSSNELKLEELIKGLKNPWSLSFITDENILIEHKLKSQLLDIIKTRKIILRTYPQKQVHTHERHYPGKGGRQEGAGKTKNSINGQHRGIDRSKQQRDLCHERKSKRMQNSSPYRAVRAANVSSSNAG